MSVPATLCPYCREPLLQAQETLCCQVCGTRQHGACWQEYNHCSVYGCPGKAASILKSHNIWKIIPALLMLFASRDNYAFATFASFFLVGSLFCVSQAVRYASILLRHGGAGIFKREDLFALINILVNLTPVALLVRSLILFYQR